jgi:hypothetical protein
MRFLVRLDACGAAIVERAGGLGTQLDRLQDVVQDQRLMVELEVPLRAGEGHCVVVAEHLQGSIVSTSHWVGLILPGIIEEPGAFSGIFGRPEYPNQARGSPPSGSGKFVLDHLDRACAMPALLWPVRFRFEVFFGKDTCMHSRVTASRIISARRNVAGPACSRSAKMR